MQVCPPAPRPTRRPAVGDHLEGEVDDEDAVVEPHRNEDDEPRPPRSLIEPEDEQYEEDEAHEPGAEGAVQHSHSWLNIVSQ